MNTDGITELLEQRINLLRLLASSLEHAQIGLQRPNCAEIQLQTKTQQNLCQQLRQVACEFSPDQIARISGCGDPVSQTTLANARQSALAAELRSLEKQVAELNRRYGALLRRAQRTINIFCRVLNNSGLTYVAMRPKPESAVEHSGG
ncbi:MAG: hypothetical protein JOZ80_16885 [Acidobacteriaceae bacterium]|nr:hypothetical protein [Acidobacteriaceae bacterium]